MNYPHSAPNRKLLFPAAVAALAVETLAQDSQSRVAFEPAPASPILVGPMPGRPVVRDMNGDGKLDVIVACGSHPDSQNAHVVVLLNDGRGRLTPPADERVKVAAGVRKVALGDLNEDGKLDVAAVEHDSYGITMLLGDGRGGLRVAPASPITAASGSRPHTHEIAVADVNDDKHLDLLTANADDNCISVLLGDGKGGFRPAEGSPFETGRHPYDALVVADMNVDGKADIVVPLLAGNQIGVLFGDGRGGFAHAPGSRYAVGERPGCVAVGDVNNDRKPDILATHDDAGILDVLLNVGEGRFTAAEGTPLRLRVPSWGIALGDLNGDGYSDAALGAMTDRKVVILLNDGRGKFDEAQDVRLEAGEQPNYVALADLNGDGRADIVTSNSGSGDVSVFVAVRPARANR